MQLRAIIFSNAALALVLCANWARADDIDPNTLQWSVAAIIDTSRNPYNETWDPDNEADVPNSPGDYTGQWGTPRDNRGIAVSPDGRYLYLGYNSSTSYNPLNNTFTDRNGEVRRVDLWVTGPTSTLDPTSKFDTQWSGRAVGNRGKAIAVDDQGRVYLAETDRIDIFNADLSQKIGTLGSLNGAEGVGLAREGGQLYLYQSSRSNGTLTKFSIDESDSNNIVGTPDANFGVAGILTLPGAGAGASLRNVEVQFDTQGNLQAIWVAGRNNNTLYRVTLDSSPMNPLGAIVESATLASPFDIAFNGTQVLVTHQDARSVSFFDVAQFVNGGAISATDLSLVGVLSDLDLESFFLNPDNATPIYISGIVVIPGVGFYVTNENGQTYPNNTSKFGALDAFSSPNGDPYQDQYEDDNEPVLFGAIPMSPVPEPAALALALMSLVGFVGYARRAGSTQG